MSGTSHSHRKSHSEQSESGSECDDFGSTSPLERLAASFDFPPFLATGPDSCPAPPSEIMIQNGQRKAEKKVRPDLNTLLGDFNELMAQLQNIPESSASIALPIEAGTNEVGNLYVNDDRNQIAEDRGEGTPFDDYNSNETAQVTTNHSLLAKRKDSNSIAVAGALQNEISTEIMRMYTDASHGWTANDGAGSNVRDNTSLDKKESESFVADSLSGPRWPKVSPSKHDQKFMQHTAKEGDNFMIQSAYSNVNTDERRSSDMKGIHQYHGTKKEEEEDFEGNKYDRENNISLKGTHTNFGERNGNSIPSNNYRAEDKNFSEENPRFARQALFSDVLKQRGRSDYRNNEDVKDNRLPYDRNDIRHKEMGEDLFLSVDRAEDSRNNHILPAHSVSPSQPRYPNRIPVMHPYPILDGDEPSLNRVAYHDEDDIEDGGPPLIAFDPRISSSEDSERLKCTNRSLSETLQKERSLRSSMDKRLQSSTEEVLEVQAQYEVEIDDYKLAIVRLKGQVRASCSQQPLTDIHSAFEEHLQRLTIENEALRDRILILESESLDTVLKFSGIVRKKGKTKSEGMSEEKGENLSFSERNLRNSDFTRQDDEFEVSQSMEDGRVARLSAKLMRVAQEKESIRQEKEGYRRALEELYGKERQYVLTQKLQADASRRLNVSNQESLKLRHELESERALRMGLERDLLLIREDTSELHESEKELKAERFRNQGELIQMREKVWELDQEKRRISHLNRFIAKHSALAPHTSLGPTPVQPPQGVAPVDHSAWEASSSTDNRSLYSVPHSQLEAKTNPQPVLKSRNSYTSTPSSTTTGTSPTVSFAANFDTTNNSFRTVNSSRTTGRLNHEAKGGMTPSHGVKSRATPNPRDGLFLSEPEGDSSMTGPAVDAALSVMHDVLMTSCPSLLPVFRRLTSEIHNDRTTFLKSKAATLGPPPSLGQQHLLQAQQDKEEVRDQRIEIQSESIMIKRLLAAQATFKRTPSTSSYSTPAFTMVNGNSRSNSVGRSRSNPNSNVSFGVGNPPKPNQDWQR